MTGRSRAVLLGLGALALGGFAWLALLGPGEPARVPERRRSPLTRARDAVRWATATDVPLARPSSSSAPGSPARAALAGRVIDPDGRAVAGARVAIRPSGGAPVLGTTTDAAGRFAFAAVPPGELELVAIATGFLVPEPVHPRGASVDVTLERGCVVRGRVEGPDGPIAGATLELDGPSLDRFASFEPLASARDGSFAIEGVPPGEGLTLVARASGFAGTSLELPPVRSPAGLNGLVVRMRRLLLRVRLVAEGVPLAPAARVVVRAPDGSDELAARTDGSRAEALLPRVGEWLVRAQQDDAESSWERVTIASDVTDATLVLAPRVLVEGTVVAVTAEGKREPLAGATVRLESEPRGRDEPRTLATGADGSFVSSVTRGRWTVVAAAGGHAPARRTVAAPARVALVLEPSPDAAPVESTPLLDARGKPVARRLLLDPDSPDEPGLEVPIDAQGRPDLAKLGAGHWTLSFPELAEGELRAWVREVDVAPGAPVRLAFSEESPRGRIDGIVRGAPPDDLVQVEVRPEPAPTDAFGFLAARALERDGRFSFPAVPPGRYLVRATWDGGAAQDHVDVRSSATSWVELTAP